MFWISGNFVKVDHEFLLVRVVIVVLMFQILMFDSIRRRTCLHYAAYYGNIDCLKVILSAAHSTPVADSWLDTILSLSLHTHTGTPNIDPSIYKNDW